jgi:hypothetical protein
MYRANVVYEKLKLKEEIGIERELHGAIVAGITHGSEEFVMELIRLSNPEMGSFF